MLMRDVYAVTILVGYQFVMRWMNAHVFYLKRKSPVSVRILEQLMMMPLNHPRFKQDIIEQVWLLLPQS